ncbi:MAG TPA: hypothetical protein DIU28_10865 [Anabaena sp. UBA12330]|nr:hypothetical protein [Anabaena sp. UBA12330]
MIPGKYFYPLPITHYQSPITNYPLPITNHPLPITNYQSPITHYQSNKCLKIPLLILIKQTTILQINGKKE